MALFTDGQLNAIIDLQNYENHWRTCSQFSSELKAEFDALYIEGEHKRRMLSVSSHDRVAGRASRTQVMDEFIAYAQRLHPENMPFKYRDHAWFTSFAPADHPELVVSVFAEHGGGGSKVAAPIAQAIYAKYFGIDNGKSPPP